MGSKRCLMKIMSCGGNCTQKYWSVNLATDRTNTSTHCVAHTTNREQLFQNIAHQYPNFLSDANKMKKDMWRCGIDALAVDFSRILKSVIFNGGGLTKLIDDILNQDWKSKDEEYEQVIYYVSGFVIRTTHNQSNDREEKLAPVLRQLEENILT